MRDAAILVEYLLDLGLELSHFSLINVLGFVLRFLSSLLFKL